MWLSDQIDTRLHASCFIIKQLRIVTMNKQIKTSRHNFASLYTFKFKCSYISNPMYRVISFALLAVVIGCSDNQEYAKVIKPSFDSIITHTTSVRDVNAISTDENTTKLSNGSFDRDTLIKVFLNAVQKNDTAILLSINMNRDEFNDVYYPGHPQSLPPYDLSAQLMWYRLSSNSDKGLRRLLRDFGGQLTTAGFACDKIVHMENGNTIHSRCAFQIPDRKEKLTLFSSIIERDGQFKILSYANEL